MTLMARFASAFVYGWGGVLTIRHGMDLGTLVALISYLRRLYGPITGLSNMQVTVMTALVSFERVFELLDLPPTIREKPDAKPLPAGPARIAFSSCLIPLSDRGARCRWPRWRPSPCLTTAPEQTVLHDLDFTVRPAR